MTKHYERFLGKICTVLTQTVSFPFTNPQQHAEFFSGLVTEINPSGIFLKNINSNTMAFYTFPIVGIVEEQTVAKSDVNYEKIKQVIEQQKRPVERPRPAPAPNITSVEDLTKMAQRIKSAKSTN